MALNTNVVVVLFTRIWFDYFKTKRVRRDRSAKCALVRKWRKPCSRSCWCSPSAFCRSTCSCCGFTTTPSPRTSTTRSGTFCASSGSVWVSSTRAWTRSRCTWSAARSANTSTNTCSAGARHGPRPPSPSPTRSRPGRTAPCWAGTRRSPSRSRCNRRRSPPKTRATTAIPRTVCETAATTRKSPCNGLPDGHLRSGRRRFRWFSDWSYYCCCFFCLLLIRYRSPRRFYNPDPFWLRNAIVDRRTRAFVSEKRIFQL